MNEDNENKWIALVKLGLETLEDAGDWTKFSSAEIIEVAYHFIVDKNAQRKDIVFINPKGDGDCMLRALLAGKGISEETLSAPGRDGVDAMRTLLK